MGFGERAIQKVSFNGQRIYENTPLFNVDFLMRGLTRMGGKRLPTEQEREKPPRPNGSLFPWGNTRSKKQTPQMSVMVPRSQFWQNRRIRRMGARGRHARDKSFTESWTWRATCEWTDTWDASRFSNRTDPPCAAAALIDEVGLLQRNLTNSPRQNKPPDRFPLPRRSPQKIIHS